MSAHELSVHLSVQPWEGWSANKNNYFHTYSWSFHTECSSLKLAGQSLSCHSILGHQHLSNLRSLWPWGIPSPPLLPSPRPLPLPVSVSVSTRRWSNSGFTLAQSIKRKNAGPHASNATELAFQALRAHSSVFTPKHRETEGGREGGMEVGYSRCTISSRGCHNISIRSLKYQF